MYGPRFCPARIDHIAEMIIFSKNDLVNNVFPKTKQQKNRIKMYTSDSETHIGGAQRIVLKIVEYSGPPATALS